jgi:para-aminobenzoate synthetase/4-amino-4-deoxychorismate lyase
VSDAAIEVRFDGFDRSRGWRSFRMVGLQGVIEANELDEVIPAVGAVEGAAARGLHAAGLIRYEAAPAFEEHLAVRASPTGMPLLWFGLFERREEVAPLEPPVAAIDLAELSPSVTEGEYRAGVERILELIRAGDTYQVNYTFRLGGGFRASDEAFYAHICAAQRASYCAYLRLPRFTIVSASPELFFRRTGDALELRPMKGTRPRGRWSEEDDGIAAELVVSEKDRAENLMIVDLVRNDAGRIARFGSVRVPELYRVERYPTVHQMTSTVLADLRAGTSLEGVLRALYPSGSVTGAPKIRTTQIIADLETSPRGVYTGAIGLVSEGEAIFSVAIRTAVIDRERETIEVGVGSGITADSEAASEWRECLQKGAFLTADVRPFRVMTALRCETGKGVFLRAAHVARLARSAAYFDFAFDRERVEETIDGAIAVLAPGTYKVRVLLDARGRVEVESESIPPSSGPVRVALAAQAVDVADPFLYHKTTRREVYAARLATCPECDDVVLANSSGRLTSATTGNIVLRVAGECWTPPIEAGALAGTFRAHLLARGEIGERPLSIADYERAEAVYVINSVRLWREAHRLDRWREEV